MNSLKLRFEIIIIQSADKEGGIVIIDKDDYVKACNYQLKDTHFWVNLDNDITSQHTVKIKNAILSMHKCKYINVKEEKFVTKDF